VNASNRNPVHDHLSIVVALSKQLSSVHHPLEHLLAYCQAVKSFCPRLENVHIAFFSRGEPLPVRVFLFGEEPGRLLCLSAGELTAREKDLFVKFSRRSRKAMAGRGDASGRSADLDFLDAFFRGSDVAEKRKPPEHPGAGRAGKDAGNRSPAEPLPLAIPSGPEGWIFFSAASPTAVFWEEVDRNAVSVCTDMLSASLDRAGLFAKVLRAKKEWERSVDAIRDVVMIVAPDYTVVRGNRQLGELAGVPVEALQGEKCHRLLASLKRPCPNCPAGATFQTGERRTAEIPRPRREALFQVWSYPLRDPAGGADSVVVYEKDVTELKRMQAQLVQAEKMAVLGELAAAVAHELNNPLSGVISFSKILLQEMDPALPYVEDMKTIEHAALRCKKIVQDLLAFARQPGTVAHEPVPLQTIVEQAHALLRPRIGEKGLRMRWNIPEDMPDFPFHPDLIHQILVNLVVNAQDASKPGDEITIEAARRKRKGIPHIVISVRDQGHGIAPGVRDRIFDPFFTTKGPGEGTGLGLSICRKLMDSFGGGIEVSSAPARGTTVSLWFPLTELSGAPARGSSCLKSGPQE
jgi:two-component system, NtrC family, sensor kinase